MKCICVSSALPENKVGEEADSSEKERKDACHKGPRIFRHPLYVSSHSVGVELEHMYVLQKSCYCGADKEYGADKAG